MTPEVLSNTYRDALQDGGADAAGAARQDRRVGDKFNQGFETVEYLSSAVVDMKLHDRKVPADRRATQFERESGLGRNGHAASEIVMRHRLPQFSHLFAERRLFGGLLQLSLVRNDGCRHWAAFTEVGDVWDKATAERFRSMLMATGNETDRIEAYRAFRGRDPDVKYIMKKRGFPVPGEETKP